MELYGRTRALRARQWWVPGVKASCIAAVLGWYGMEWPDPIAGVRGAAKRLPLQDHSCGRLNKDGGTAEQLQNKKTTLY